MKFIKRMTDRTENSINSYFDEVNKIPMLTLEDEVKYGKLMRDGDENAKDMLIKSNLRFVISVAKQYQGRGVSLSDLINEGNIGLMIAAPKFDETRGFKFISFAVHYIRREIGNIVKDSAWCFTTPMHKVDMLNRFRGVVKRLENELEREVSVNDIYGVEEFKDYEIDELHEILSRCSVSMNIETSDDTNTFCLEIPSTSFVDMGVEINNDYNSTLICSMTNKLPKKHRDVVSHIHGVDGYELLTTSTLAKKLGLSRQRIDQIYKDALKKLRSMHTNITLAGNV